MGTQNQNRGSHSDSKGHKTNFTVDLRIAEDLAHPRGGACGQDHIGVLVNVVCERGGSAGTKIV